MLSPVLFIVVLPSTLSFPVDFPPEVHLTLFSGDICFWVSARLNKPLALRLEADLDHVTSRLEHVGVVLSQERTTSMVFAGGGRRTKKVALLFGHEPVTVVQTEISWPAPGLSNTLAVSANQVAASCVAPLNALRRVSSNFWGSLPASLIRLRSALVGRRLLYVFPFSDPAPSQVVQIERIHGVALDISLVVPLQILTLAVLKEFQAPALRDASQ